MPRRDEGWSLSCTALGPVACSRTQSPPRQLLTADPPPQITPAAAGFADGGAGLRATGIMLAGKKWMFLRADEEMMCGKSGAEGVNIFKAGTCIFIGTHDKDMSPAMNSKETGKMADYLKEQGY